MRARPIEKDGWDVLWIDIGLSRRASSPFGADLLLSEIEECEDLLQEEQCTVRLRGTVRELLVQE